MQTQCPKCTTVFRITDEQLQAAMGMVRCGQCQHIFNAIDHQEGAYPRTAQPVLEEHEPGEILRRALSPTAPPRHPWVFTGWILSILLAGLVLLAQIAYWQRDAWAQHPPLRPYIEQACERIPNCTLAAKRDIDKLELISRNIYTHPNIKSALMISAVIANKAETHQPYPLLLVSMSNVRGQIVAQRYFKPAEYLPAQQILETFQSNTTLTVNLEIVDPGNDAMAFELDFL